MKVLATLTFLFMAVGPRSVTANPCDAELVNTCYHVLVHYEGLGFPLYGENETRLDETCSNINTSFACIESFLYICPDTTLCDSDCNAIIPEIRAFAMHTGLRSFADEMCNQNKVLRETYLENYHCLEKHADDYAACHNDSQLSQEFMSEFTGADVIQQRCCFFSWYHDCFTNITRDNCGVNATVFVSLSLHKLVGHISEQLCASTNIICDRPPLPGTDTEDALDKDKPSKVDVDIDNEVQKASAAVFTHSLSALLSTFSFVTLLKYLL